MNSRRKLKLIRFMAFTALALLAGSSLEAQEMRRGKTTPSSEQAPVESNALALLSGSAAFPGDAATRPNAGPAGSHVIVHMPMESGYASRPASPEFHRVSEVEQEPRALSIPPVVQDATLAFPSERKRYWQSRAGSAIPQDTRSGMFPGSRLRGPFDQTYPRPFPGGGQA